MSSSVFARSLSRIACSNSSRWFPVLLCKQLQNNVNKKWNAATKRYTCISTACGSFPETYSHWCGTDYDSTAQSPSFCWSAPVECILQMPSSQRLQPIISKAFPNSSSNCSSEWASMTVASSLHTACLFSGLFTLVRALKRIRTKVRYLSNDKVFFICLLSPSLPGTLQMPGADEPGRRESDGTLEASQKCWTIIAH